MPEKEHKESAPPKPAPAELLTADSWARGALGVGFVLHRRGWLKSLKSDRDLLRSPDDWLADFTKWANREVR